MKINLVCADLSIREKMIRRQDAVSDGDWDTPLGRPFEELDVFLAFRDRFELAKRWEETDFYSRIVKSISDGTPKWGCSTEEQFHKRLTEVVEPLYFEIKENGYRTQPELGGDPRDEVRVGIRHDGRFIFMDGKHRLAIARLLRMPEIPVLVVVRHQEWEGFRDEIREYAKSRLRGKIYQAIDHPDLAEIRAHKGGERVQMLREALTDYDSQGKALLDIGTDWGYMAQQMEKLGFRCTGVESNDTNVYFANKIRTATESSFEIWHGNVLDLKEPRADVVLALNIFHHLIKTKARHEGLVNLLGLLSPEIILFEPHVPERAFRQMEGAYRNYEPPEFAEFVVKHAGLSKIEYLGETDAQRPLFKLSR
jgi:hypothetical protein